MNLVKFLCECAATATFAQGRRLIAQGVIFVNGSKVVDLGAQVNDGDEVVVKTANGGARTFIARKMPAAQ